MAKLYAWIDIEATGLEPKNHDILEIACVVTNAKLEIQRKLTTLVRLEDGVRSSRVKADDYVDQMHETSGLWRDLSNPDLDHINLSVIDEEMCSIFDSLSHDCESIIPCGNNVAGYDLTFMRAKGMKSPDMLHYRSVDVSSLWEASELAFGLERPKGDKVKHRAIEDCLTSIGLFKLWREQFS